MSEIIRMEVDKGEDYYNLRSTHELKKRLGSLGWSSNLTFYFATTTRDPTVSFQITRNIYNSDNLEYPAKPDSKLGVFITETLLVRIKKLVHIGS